MSSLPLALGALVLRGGLFPLVSAGDGLLLAGGERRRGGGGDLGASLARLRLLLLLEAESERSLARRGGGERDLEADLERVLARLPRLTRRAGGERERDLLLPRESLRDLLPLLLRLLLGLREYDLSLPLVVGGARRGGGERDLLLPSRSPGL